MPRLKPGMTVYTRHDVFPPGKPPIPGGTKLIVKDKYKSYLDLHWPDDTKAIYALHQENVTWSQRAAKKSDTGVTDYWHKLGGEG